MSLGLDVKDLVVCKGGYTLLDKISFSVEGGELVAILGPNGAGKTTLLRAIAGERPYSGSICIGADENRENLYDDPEKWFKEIGQVPTDNVLHESLPVSTALEYVGRLRGIDPSILKSLIDDRLEQFGIGDKSHSLISQLSSGERKKVNICAELLTEPGLLLLDEPTTNLDPYAEAELMNRLAKRASDGTTIIVVSHTIHSLSQCNYIIFVGRSKIQGFIERGTQEWKWTDPDDTRQVRKTVSDDKFSEWLMHKFEEHQTEKRWPGPPSSKRTPPSSSPSSYTVGGDPKTAWQHYKIILIRQLKLLYYEGWRIPVRQTWELITGSLFSKARNDRRKSNKRNILDWNWMVPLPLLVALALGPLTGLLLLAVLPQEALIRSADESVSLDAGYASTAAFLIGLVALLLGLMGSFREVVREINIYQHERLKGLRAKPYLLAKFTLLGILYGIIAPMSMFFVLGVRQDFPLKILIFGGNVNVLLSLVLTSIAGVALGLSISCVGSSGEWTTVFMAASVIANALLSGLIQNKTLEKLIDIASVLIPSRWAMEGLKTTTELYCWGVQRMLRDHYSPAHLLAVWTALVAYSLVALIIAYLALHRRDTWFKPWERLKLLVSRGNYVYIVVSMIIIAISFGLYRWSIQADGPPPLYLEDINELHGLRRGVGWISAVRCERPPSTLLVLTPMPTPPLPITVTPTSISSTPLSAVTPTATSPVVSEPTVTIEPSPTSAIPSEPAVVVSDPVGLHFSPTGQYPSFVSLLPDSTLTLLSKAERKQNGAPWLRVQATDEIGRDYVGWVYANAPLLAQQEWKVNPEPKTPPDCAEPLASTYQGMANFDLMEGNLGTWTSNGSGEIAVVVDLYRKELEGLSDRLTLHFQKNGQDVRTILIEPQRKRFLLQSGVYNVQVSAGDRVALLITPSSSNTLRTLHGYVSIFLIPQDCEFGER